MKERVLRAQVHITMGLGFLSIGALLLLGSRFYSAGNLRYGYLGWNLFLAWVPLVAAYGLYIWIRNHRWSSWQGVCLSFIWLAFLPNSFYLVSDLIHLQNTGEISLLFDTVLFMLFALNGIILGFIALRLVHGEFAKRFSAGLSWCLVGGSLLLSSFAIYLGRVQRWNSWDIILHPIGILLDVSDGLISGVQSVNILTTTLLFFGLSITVYVGLYKLLEGARRLPEK